MAHANRSVHTRRAYAYDLASLFRFHPGPASSITPETLRSFFATIATIRKRLGHRNLQTTLRYAEQSDAVADAELRAWRRRAIQGHRHLAEPYPLFVRDYSGPPRRSAIRASSSSQGALQPGVRRDQF